MQDTQTISYLLQGILIAFIPSVLVALFTAWVTVKFSMQQFFEQRWWEKKAETYSQIVEALSYLQYHNVEWLDSQIEGKTLSGPKVEKLSEGYFQAKEEIAKASAMGAYIISEDATVALKKLVKNFERYSQDMVADLERDFDLIEICIKEVKSCAKRDLGLK